MYLHIYINVHVYTEHEFRIRNQELVNKKNEKERGNGGNKMKKLVIEESPEENNKGRK